MRRFLHAAIRGPLLHFLLIGALLFAFTALRQQEQEQAEVRATTSLATSAPRSPPP